MLSILGTIAVLFIFGVLYLTNKEQTVTVKQVDENQTLIKKSRQIRVPLLAFNLGSEYPLSGYRATHAPHLTLGKQRITIMYEPVQSSTQQLKLLQKRHYVASAFQVVNATTNGNKQTIPKNQHEIDRLRILYSDDGIKWQTLHTNYPNWGIRDPDIIHYKKVWYVVYTAGLMKTTDFRHWQQISWNYNSAQQFKWFWAPEFFVDKAGQYHVVVSATQDGTNFGIYETDFNPETGQAGTQWTQISNSKVSPNAIDPHLFVWNNQYKLLTKDENAKQLNIADSDTYDSNFINSLVDIPNLGDLKPEAPEAEPLNDADTTNKGLRVYFDVYDMQGNYYGIHYTDSDASLSKWSQAKAIKANFIVRHFGIWNNVTKK